MIPSFVKKFDIRGEYGVDISDKDAYYLGRAIRKTFDLHKVLIGWDSRSISKMLAMSVLRAWRDASFQVDYLDTIPIEFVTAGAYALDYDLSIMFTGSHNPYNWSGLLMHSKGGQSIKDEMVETIIANYKTSLHEEYSDDPISLDAYANVEEEITQIYEARLRELTPVDKIREFDILVDLGDGSGGKGVSVLEKVLPQVKVWRIHDRGIYDAASTHIADPSEEENMEDVIREIKEKGFYDIGFAFDSDADRMLAVSEKGEYINGSMLGGVMMVSLLRLKNSDDTKFGYAIECGPSMYNAYMSMPEEQREQYALLPVPVGRSIIRSLLRDGTVDFAVENVGHFYAKDFFMTDSSIFSIILTLLWMSDGHKISAISSMYPDGQRVQSRDNLGTYLDTHPYYVYQDFLNMFGSVKRYEIDGIRGEAFDTHGYLSSWFCLRHSGYEKIEKYYYGSIDPDSFVKLKALFDTYLKHHHS